MFTVGKKIMTNGLKCNEMTTKCTLSVDYVQIFWISINNFYDIVDRITVNLKKKKRIKRKH